MSQRRNKVASNTVLEASKAGPLERKVKSKCQDIFAIMQRKRLYKQYTYCTGLKDEKRIKSFGERALWNFLNMACFICSRANLKMVIATLKQKWLEIKDITANQAEGLSWQREKLSNLHFSLLNTELQAFKHMKFEKIRKRRYCAGV